MRKCYMSEFKCIQSSHTIRTKNSVETVNLWQMTVNTARNKKKRTQRKGSNAEKLSPECIICCCERPFEFLMNQSCVSYIPFHFQAPILLRFVCLSLYNSQRHWIYISFPLLFGAANIHFFFFCVFLSLVCDLLLIMTNPRDLIQTVVSFSGSFALSVSLVI